MATTKYYYASVRNNSKWPVAYKEFIETGKYISKSVPSIYSNSLINILRKDYIQNNRSEALILKGSIENNNVIFNELIGKLPTGEYNWKTALKTLRNKED